MNRLLKVGLVGISQNDLKMCAEKAEKLGLKLEILHFHNPDELKLAKSTGLDITFYHADWIESTFFSFSSPPAILQVEKAVDTIIHFAGNSWPYFLFRSALKRIIVEQAKSLDTSQAALIIGSGPYARSMASVLIEMGFKKLNLIMPGPEDVAHYKRAFFGVEITEFSKEQLVLQPGIHSVLVITQFFSEDDPYLNDILYFNYLKTQSLIINFFSDGTDIIMTESKAITNFQITGHQIIETIYCLAFEKWLEVFKKSA